MSISAGPLVCAGDAAAGGGCDAAAGAGGLAPDDGAVGVTGALDGGASAAGGALGLPVAGGAACWAAAIPCAQIRATDVVPNKAQRATQTRIHSLQRTAIRHSKDTNM